MGSLFVDISIHTHTYIIYIYIHIYIYMYVSAGLLCRVAIWALSLSPPKQLQAGWRGQEVLFAINPHHQSQSPDMLTSYEVGFIFLVPPKGHPVYTLTKIKKEPYMHSPKTAT